MKATARSANPFRIFIQDACRTIAETVISCQHSKISVVLSQGGVDLFPQVSLAIIGRKQYFNCLSIAQPPASLTV